MLDMDGEYGSFGGIEYDELVDEVYRYICSSHRQLVYGLRSVGYLGDDLLQEIRLVVWGLWDRLDWGRGRDKVFWYCVRSVIRSLYGIYRRYDRRGELWVDLVDVSGLDEVLCDGDEVLCDGGVGSLGDGLVGDE